MKVIFICQPTDIRSSQSNTTSKEVTAVKMAAGIVPMISKKEKSKGMIFDKFFSKKYFL
jgi:hypothetical protein